MFFGIHQGTRFWKTPEYPSRRMEDGIETKGWTPRGLTNLDESRVPNVDKRRIDGLWSGYRNRNLILVLPY